MGGPQAHDNLKTLQCVNGLIYKASVCHLVIFIPASRTRAT